MKSVPSLPPTAVAASTIWSGVGEVKTCPGQAASSIPVPTKPICSGSCPLPPPEIKATLFKLGEQRHTNLRSGPRATTSECAAAKPSRLSARKSSTELMNFFMIRLTRCALDSPTSPYPLAGSRLVVLQTLAAERRILRSAFDFQGPEDAAKLFARAEFRQAEPVCVDERERKLRERPSLWMAGS